MATTCGAESMTAEELQSLDLARLGFALSELLVALAATARDAIDARKRMGRARVSWRRKDGSFASKDAFEAELEEARTEFDSLRLRAASLRDLKSTLQTIIRAIP
jgi:hypothetical protein